MQAESRYTDDEKAGIQKKFRATIVRERLFVRVGFAILGVIFVIGLALLFLVPGGYKGLIVVLLLIVLAVFAFVLRMQPTLKCPGCKRQLEGSLGNYCPECGGRSLTQISRLEAHCAACNRKLKFLRSHGWGSILARRFKIRACTHCGVTLSRSGI